MAGPADEVKPPAQAHGTRKYEVHLSDGRTFTCIDLIGDPPDVVERGIHEMFGHYGVKEIRR